MDHRSRAASHVGRVMCFTDAASRPAYGEFMVDTMLRSTRLASNLAFTSAAIAMVQWALALIMSTAMVDEDARTESLQLAAFVGWLAAAGLAVAAGNLVARRPVVASALLAIVAAALVYPVIGALVAGTGAITAYRSRDRVAHGGGGAAQIVRDVARSMSVFFWLVLGASVIATISIIRRFFG